MAQAEAKLNDQQRKAVEHDGGPLMVLAGPGTGKTRVITHRIAHLIGQRGVEPETIVAVTYTVKAAAQLRERLFDLVGDAAERVHTHTFHGLGLRIVRRFADEVGVHLAGFGEGSGGIVDSAQQRRMLRAIVTQHGLFAHARGEGVDSAVDQIIEYAASLSNAGISPADVKKFVNEARVWLDKGQNWRGEGIDAEAVLAERGRVRVLAEAAEAIEHFGKACRSEGLLTYDDMISLPIRILREGRHAAAILRDEWRHMVVDEFQDANTAQIELLRLLMPPGGESGPKRDLCVVGDDDQSIYEFRGADDLAFHRFKTIWPDAARIDLQSNYRSTPPIVAVANSIIGKAKTRFAADKIVQAAGGNERAIPVECVQLEDDNQSGEVIAAMLLIDRAENPTRSWSKTAVVVHAHIDAERIRAALQIEGIPAIAAREGTPAEDEGVRDVLAWVELLATPHATHPAMRLLTRPPISMDLKSASSLQNTYRTRLTRFQAGEPGGTDPGGFVDWLASHAPDDPCVQRLAAIYEELRRLASDQSAAEVIFRIITIADAAHADLLPARERADRVTNLVAMLRFARERQDRLEPPGDVRAFWTYWNDLAERDRTLSGGALNDRVDGLGNSDDDESEDAVRLITAHSSKGLEFDTVFVPRISPAHGYGAASERGGPDLPSGLVRRGDDRTGKDRAAAEARRVFYVACTRAERRLVLMSKKNKSRSKSTHYFEEIVHDASLKTAIQVREGLDHIKRAAQLGLGRGFGWSLGEEGEIDAAGRGFKVLQRRREVFERTRREIRMSAAAALDKAAGAEDALTAVESSAVALRVAAARLAALDHADSKGVVPAWAVELGASEYVRAVMARAGANDDAPATGSFWSAPGLPSPLRLSYTDIHDYLACPRCYYLRRVLQLKPMAGKALVTGIAVHEALERFATEFRAAESSESPRPAPGRDRLLTIGREAFFRHWPRHLEADRKQLDQVLAQLAIFFDRLHDPKANILEIEKSVEFKYGPHKFKSKMDRIDQITTADGAAAFRIVDYKTGRTSGKLTEPKASDLQLGIYALALSHHYGTGDPAADALSGTAEYWVLSTGQRGVLDLSAIRHDKIKSQIDEAVEGMLAGRWESKKGCEGDCSLLGSIAAQTSHGPTIEPLEWGSDDFESNQDDADE